MSIPREIIDRTLATPQGEAAYEITTIFLDAGHECWWVGGAPRDMLLERIPIDIDLATSATPDQVISLFPKSDPAAATLGSVLISHKGHIFEVTTFRVESSTSDGRRPEAITMGTREQDAIRRDATVNAIYWNAVSRELFDPCEGEEDLKERLVQFIGKPEARIQQDALRILRLVRLRAGIDGQYHPDTYHALRKYAHLTAALSGTRILEELEKILFVAKPSKALRDLEEMGILKEILPEISVCKGVAQPRDYHREGDVFEHLLQSIDAAGEDHGIDVRLATLFHDIGKAKTFAVKERIRFDHHAEVSETLTENIAQRLQMPTARMEKVCWIIAHHMMMGTLESLTEERKAHWYFHPWFQELLQLMFLDIAGTTPSDFALYESIIKDYDEFLNTHPRKEKPFLTGDEVMQLLGIGAGVRVGKILQDLHDAQMRKQITTKNEAKAFLKTKRGNC